MFRTNNAARRVGWVKKLSVSSICTEVAKLEGRSTEEVGQMIISSLLLFSQRRISHTMVDPPRSVMMRRQDKRVMVLVKAPQEFLASIGEVSQGGSDILL